MFKTESHLTKVINELFAKKLASLNLLELGEMEEFVFEYYRHLDKRYVNQLLSVYYNDVVENLYDEHFLEFRGECWERIWACLSIVPPI